MFNTLFGLLNQARQAECFASVVRVLDPGGMFVIECFVLDLNPVRPRSAGPGPLGDRDSAIIEVCRVRAHDTLDGL